MIDFISYEEIVQENKKRKEQIDIKQLKRLRIQSIVPNQKDFAITVFNVNRQVEMIFPLEKFITAFLNQRDIYFTNITVVPEFKDAFKYKSMSARIKASKNVVSKAIKSNKKVVQQAKQSNLQKDKLLEIERYLKDDLAKQKVNKSDGLTVIQLTIQCLSAIRQGNGYKHLLLSDMDEINELHTCWEGLADIDTNYFSSSDCHDNNDVSQCMMIF